MSSVFDSIDLKMRVATTPWPANRTAEMPLRSSTYEAPAIFECYRPRMRIQPLALARIAGVLWLLAPTHAFAAAQDRSSAVGPIYVEINLAENRKVAGIVKDLDGGYGTAEVIREPSEGAVRKRLGAISYEPIVVTVDPCAFQPWIRHILANGHFTGKIYRIDALGNVAGLQTFGDSYATDLHFSALDGASKDLAFLTVTFVPESVTSIPPAEVEKPAGLDRAAAHADTIRANNFRIEIPAVDTKMVRGIAAFTAHIEDGTLDIPDLKVTISNGAGAQSWRDWHEKFVINAQNDVESSLRFTYLKPDMTTEICSYQMGGVGIVALRRGTPAKASEQPPVDAELYVETLQVPAHP